MGLINMINAIPRPAPEVICPMCQVKGNIYTSQLKRKRGVSGGKAVGAFLTCGLSMLAVGLSRKESVMHARCENCKSEWDF